VVLTAEEVREAIDEPVSAMVDAVISCLGQAPPELAQDLIGQGIHLVGGGGMLRGLDLRLEAETDIPVQLVDLPLESVVLGAGHCVESFDQLRVMFME
jgi:rod shape-determining protein MreB